MFRAAWLELIALLLALGLIFRFQPLILIALLLLGMVLLGWAWRRFLLSGVEAALTATPERLFVEETAEVRLEVSNRKLLPVPWVEVAAEVPETLTAREELRASEKPGRMYLIRSTPLRWYERVRWTLPVGPLKRGLYHLGPVRLRASDLFGLFEQETLLPASARILVYPRILELPKPLLPFEHPLGKEPRRRSLFADPSRVRAVREYRPGDPLKMIHWPTTARTGELFVRDPEPSGGLSLTILLNLETFERFWEGVEPAGVERAISVAASLARAWWEAGYEVGLRINGVSLDGAKRVRLLPSRNPDQLIRILELLAGLKPYPSVPFHWLLREPLEGWGRTLIVVTNVLSTEARALLEGLARGGHTVRIVHLDWEPPVPVSGAETLYWPPDREDPERVLAAPTRWRGA